MKQPLLIVVISTLLFAFNAIGQKISYSYDNAGNRIKREIVLSPKKMTQKLNMDNSSVSDVLGDKTIKLHSNPSEGVVSIEIVGYEYSDMGEISLFSISGQMLYKFKITSNLTDIDISGFPDGVYILSILLNDNVTSWRIII